MNKLINKINVPSTWCQQSKHLEVMEVELKKDSAEYLNNLNLLSGVALENIVKIVRIQNPYLYGRYLLKKEEYSIIWPDCERTLLHATDATNVKSIISENLDWRLVERHKYGKGVSFSSDAIYANQECSKLNGNYRAMLICKVLVKSSHFGTINTTIPAKYFDTTIDPNGKVIVKYSDDEFYPEYVAYYKEATATSHIRPVKRRALHNIQNSRVFTDNLFRYNNQEVYNNHYGHYNNHEEYYNDFHQGYHNEHYNGDNRHEFHDFNYHMNYQGYCDENYYRYENHRRYYNDHCRGDFFNNHYENHYDYYNDNSHKFYNHSNGYSWENNYYKTYDYYNN